VLIVADDTGTDPEPTGAERYLADRLRDPKYRAAYAAFRSQFPLPDTADDTGTHTHTQNKENEHG
jgi:hypothetical protein